MSRDNIAAITMPLLKDVLGASNLPSVKPEIENRKAEAKRVIKRIFGIILEHREASLQLDVELNWEELSIVITALRDHAKGRLGTLKLNDYDEIEPHCLNRLFEELVEEPCNIFYVTPTSPSSTRYNSMDPSFWIECLDLLEREIISNISNQ